MRLFQRLLFKGVYGRAKNARLQSALYSAYSFDDAAARGLTTQPSGFIRPMRRSFDGYFVSCRSGTCSVMTTQNATGRRSSANVHIVFFFLLGGQTERIIVHHLAAKPRRTGGSSYRCCQADDATVLPQSS